jgi:polyisoprenoid-binding protein YceI
MKKLLLNKNTLLFAIVLLCYGRIEAQRYIPTDKNSTVEFKIVNHLVVTSNVTGHFTGLKGNIEFYPSEPQKSSFDASVSVATISTGIGKRDKDLKKDEFFNVDKFPTIHFRSSKVEKGRSANTYMMTGELTMKAKTMKVQVPFTATPASGGYKFKSNFKLNRVDYGVGTKGKIEDNLDVVLDVFARKA